MLATRINWDAVLITTATVGVFVLALCTAGFAWLVAGLRSQIRETVKPTFDSLDITLKEGFDSVATSMTDVKERVARLEGIASVTAPQKEG